MLTQLTRRMFEICVMTDTEPTAATKPAADDPTGDTRVQDVKVQDVKVQDTEVRGTGAQSGPEDAARAAAERWIAAHGQAGPARAGDGDAVTRAMRPAWDVLLSESSGSLERLASDPARSRLRDWFAMFKAPVDCRIRSLSVAVREDTAFCHGVVQLRGIGSGMASGDEPAAAVLRVTLVLRHMRDRWAVTQEQVAADPVET